MVAMEEVKTIIGKHPISVLVIEDNEIFSDGLSVLLSNNNINVLTVVSAEDGIAKLEDDKPDVLLLDIMLGDGMDGLDCLTFLKRDVRFQHIPVIIISALSKIDNINLGLSLGANDYLTKPFSAEELIMKIANLAYITQKAKNYNNHLQIVDQVTELDADYKLSLQFAELVMVEVNSGRPILVKEIARRLNTTYTKLDIVIKKYYNKTPVNYILLKRLQRADLMVRTSNMTIKDIAYNTGFNSVTYFCTAYKTHFGMSPLESRNK